ncbi:MAG: HD domain-containing protein [Methanoregula sp.]|nr:HD domain-containing protein [Methanoregula sp.]
MKIIKDPVHGYVEAEDFILPLLDSPVLQRLRYIRQLGFSYLVYPGANHTRFEHSLGTMFLADIAARRFGLEDDERMLVTAAGLLHDVGHGPFSHASEPLMEEYLHTSHDEIGPVIEGPVHDTLTGIGVDPQELGEVVRGRHRLSGIIHGDLDVDRMDYLLRDAYYTGAPYGTVDAQRLIRYLIRTDEGTAVDENGMNAAEALLIARTQMRPSVYYHHVSRIGESMFQLGVLEHLKGDTRKLEVMMAMDDATCLHELLVSGEVIARDIARRLYERRLYKRALYVGSDQVNTAVYEAGVPIARRRAIGREIAEAAGVPAHEVLIDIPPIPREMSLGVRVRNRNAIIRFEEISPRIRTLNATRKEQWRLGVYTLHEHRNKVAEAGCDLLHIKKPTRQGTLF